MPMTKWRERIRDELEEKRKRLITRLKRERVSEGKSGKVIKHIERKKKKICSTHFGGFWEALVLFGYSIRMFGQVWVVAIIAAQRAEEIIAQFLRLKYGKVRM